MSPSPGFTVPVIRTTVDAHHAFIRLVEILADRNFQDLTIGVFGYLSPSAVGLLKKSAKRDFSVRVASDHREFLSHLDESVDNVVARVTAERSPKLLATNNYSRCPAAAKPPKRFDESFERVIDRTVRAVLLSPISIQDERHIIRKGLLVDVKPELGSQRIKAVVREIMGILSALWSAKSVSLDPTRCLDARNGAEAVNALFAVTRYGQNYDALFKSVRHRNAEFHVPPGADLVEPDGSPVHRAAPRLAGDRPRQTNGTVRPTDRYLVEQNNGAFVDDAHTLPLENPSLPDSAVSPPRAGAGDMHQPA